MDIMMSGNKITMHSGLVLSKHFLVIEGKTGELKA